MFIIGNMKLQTTKEIYYSIKKCHVLTSFAKFVFGL